VTDGLVVLAAWAMYGVRLALFAFVILYGGRQRWAGDAETSGRVAAVTHRGTFDLVRERLGPRAGLVNLVASFLVTALTFAAEIGGVAPALERATSVTYPLRVVSSTSATDSALRPSGPATVRHERR
jgi:hypothetical protein